MRGQVHPEDGQVLITGPNRGSNRLLALDLSLSVAAGVKALGRYTTCPGPVLYLSGVTRPVSRDADGVDRLAGLGGRSPDPVGLPVRNVRSDEGDRRQGPGAALPPMVKDGLAGQPLSLLVLDCPENLKPANLARLREQLGCPVLVTQGEDGNALREASDVVLYVDHPARRNATHLVLQRQLPAGQPLRLTLRKAYLPDGSVTRILWPTR